MASVYPNALDILSSASNPTLTHRNVAEAIEAVQSALGVKMKNTRVVGEVIAFAGASAPNGWLICDGAEYNRTTYADLFAVISTTYGIGNNSTTFNIPNLKGKVITGIDAAQTEFNTRGAVGGAKTHTLNTNEIPAHAHAEGTELWRNTGGSVFFSGGSTYYHGTSSVGGAPRTNTDNTGGGAAHNNLQPYMNMHYIIYTGVFA